MALNLASLPLLWLVAALLFTMVEILVTSSFGFILVGGAALVTSVLANYLHVWELQVVIFALVVFLFVFMLRPKLIAKIQKTAALPSRTEALFGKGGVVTDDIDPLTGTGRILVEGQDWAARASVAIPKGTSVEVESADGIVLHVKKGS